MAIERKLQNKTSCRPGRLEKGNLHGGEEQEIYLGVFICSSRSDMPQHHDCHDHGHDHDTPELGFQDNLFSHIDRSNVVALNAKGNGSDIIKPWHDRLDETKVQCLTKQLAVAHFCGQYLDSDVDDQLYTVQL